MEDRVYEVYDKTATEYTTTSRFIAQDEYKTIYPDRPKRRKNYIFPVGVHLKIPRKEANFLARKYKGKIMVIRRKKGK